MPNMQIKQVDWPVKGVFRISRSALRIIPTIQVELRQGDYVGRGECRPYARYDETCQSVTEILNAVKPEVESGLTREALQTALPAGAARNALDCAMWDLEAKMNNITVSSMLGLSPPRIRETAFTLSIDTPDAMATAARQATKYPVLKLKIKDAHGFDAVHSVIAARPDARIIIDANEALSPDETLRCVSMFNPDNVILIEQPLHDNDFDKLPKLPDYTSPICADESLHSVGDLEKLWAAGYRAVNVKLDKCGGLTAGLQLMQAAKAKGFTIMSGCMVGSSLAMAPMVMLESYADVIDLDGPLLLDVDIEHGLKYSGAKLYPPTQALWG